MKTSRASWSRLLLAILFCSCLEACASPASPRPQPTPAARKPQAPEEFSAVINTPVTLRFQLFLPREYGADPARRWPMILFLHGAGERGDDLELVKVHGPPKIAERDPEFPFIVVSPQCPRDSTWSDEDLNVLLDHVLENWAVDPERVILTGLSMGGYGAWSLAQASPERFAAVVPICGGGSPIRARLYGDSPKGRALRKLPFWAFHGEQDPVVAPAESVRMVEALRGVGCAVEFTLYPGVGHDSWVKAYDTPELYTWMLAQSRGD